MVSPSSVNKIKSKLTFTLLPDKWDTPVFAAAYNCDRFHGKQMIIANCSISVAEKGNYIFMFLFFSQYNWYKLQEAEIHKS